MQLPNTLSLTNFSLILRSGLFFTGMVLSSAVFGPLMVLCAFLPFAWRYQLANLWVRLNLWSLEKLCNLTFEVHGLQHIPPSGAGIVLCKHQSAWETFALQRIFPPLTFILKRELLHIPVWGWAMATLRPIAIDRSKRSQALKLILREGEKRLQDGLWVVLFPEGTRLAPGQRVRFASSGGMLAHRTGVPVFPVAHNAGTFWKRQGYFKYPGIIQVVIGPPIDPTVYSASEINHLAETWIAQQMAIIEH